MTVTTIGSNIIYGDETTAADANETTSILVGGSRSNVDIEDENDEQKQKQKRNYHVHLRWLLLTVVVVMMLIGNNAWKKSSPSSSDSQLLPSSIAVIMDTTTIPSTSYSSLSSSLSSTTAYDHDYDPPNGPSVTCILIYKNLPCICGSDSDCRTPDCSCDEAKACCDAAHNYACHVSCNSGSCGNVAIRANTQDDCDVISKNLGCHDCKTRQQSKEILEPYPNKVNAGYNYVTLCPYSVMELTEC